MPRKSGDTRGTRQWQARRAMLIAEHPWCALCGREPEDTSLLHVDHITPVRLGGTDDPENLRVLCWRCNTRLGARVGNAVRRSPRRRVFGGDSSTPQAGSVSLPEVAKFNHSRVW